MKMKHDIVRILRNALNPNGESAS